MKRIAGLIPFLLIISTGVAQVEDPLLHCQSLLLDEEYRELIIFTDSLGPEAEILYFRGTAYRELSILDSALQCYTHASEIDTGNLSYLKAVGLTLHRLGRVNESTNIYERVLSLNPDDRKTRADLAALYSLRKQYDSSLNTYLFLLEKDSLNYYFLKQAGKCYLEMNRPDSALVYFESAFKQNPHDVNLTQQICNIYLKKKDINMAAESIQKGFIYDTSNLDLLKLRGYIWLLLEKYQMAILDLQKARELDSSSVFILKYLGLSLHEEKRFDEARESLMAAFLLDSLDAETTFFLASSCRWSGYEDDGVRYYKKSIELRQPNPVDIINTYLQMAELLKVLHRFDEALKSFDDALKYDPNNNVIYFKIGQVYDQNLNQKKTAIAYYEKYLDEGPTDQVIFTLSEARSEFLEQHVRERIDKLKQDLFFEQ